MNLIEQLGGYDRASKIANCESGVVHPTKALLDALLEYRRANNIFEVGDRVIHKWESDELYTVMSHTKDHTVIISERNFIGISGWLHNCIRHATDGEIKAGRRL